MSRRPPSSPLFSYTTLFRSYFPLCHYNLYVLFIRISTNIKFCPQYFSNRVICLHKKLTVRSVYHFKKSLPFKSNDSIIFGKVPWNHQLAISIQLHPCSIRETNSSVLPLLSGDLLHTKLERSRYRLLNSWIRKQKCNH